MLSKKQVMTTEADPLTKICNINSFEKNNSKQKQNSMCETQKFHV